MSVPETTSAEALNSLLGLLREELMRGMIVLLRPHVRYSSNIGTGEARVRATARRTPSKILSASIRRVRKQDYWR
jgi:hypothetical protein